MTRFDSTKPIVFSALVALISLASHCQQEEFVPPPVCEKAPGEYWQ